MNIRKNLKRKSPYALPYTAKKIKEPDDPKEFHKMNENLSKNISEIDKLKNEIKIIETNLNKQIEENSKLKEELIQINDFQKNIESRIK